MTKRTSINDAISIEDGQDLERIVSELLPIFIAHIPKMKPKALP